MPGRNLNKLDKWAIRNIVKLYKSKGKFLCLGWNKPMTGHQLEFTGIAAILQKWTL